VDITLAEYLEHGGIESALERHADQVFDNFSDVQKILARSIFAKLVELEQGGVVTRRTAILQNLIPADSSTEAVKKVVGELAEERVHLITIGEMDSEEEVGVEPTSQTYVTLAHEKLIDAWPWLRKLVDQNREIIALQNEIYRDACAWLEDLSSISALVGNTPREAVDGSSDAGGYLYESRQLRKVEEKLGLLQPNLDVLSLRFIEASRALRERRKSESRQ